MKTAHALVLDGHGLNCAREMALGFQLVGASATICHLNDLTQHNLLDYDILVLPGGFSFGDHLGSGRALAQRLLRPPLAQPIAAFVAAGRLIWGVCNGFQTLVQMGLLPGSTGQASLIHNRSGRFECRWVELAAQPDSPCLFTQGMQRLQLPVRHGEGQLLGHFPDSQVPLRYLDSQGQPTSDYPANPNGSPGGAAALCDASGKIFGLMPHPEAFLRFTQHPHWTQRREQLRRSGQSCPVEGHGLEFFRNAKRAAEESLLASALPTRG
jgi:phosphoribosylformylglycinamidine synthase I